MNQAQFYCRSIKRLCNNKPLLPVEYQQVEYLQSSGGQLINTQINPDSGSVLTVRTKFSGGNFNGSCIMGAQGAYRTAVVYGYTANMLGIGNGNVTGTSTNTKFSSAEENTLEFTVNDTTKKITGTHNNTTLTSSLYSNTYAGKSVFLYGNNHTYPSNSSVALYYWICYIGNVKMRELIPCYRISDNKPGMFDLVTRTFYTNIGTGADFTVGNNV